MKTNIPIKYCKECHVDTNEGGYAGRFRFQLIIQSQEDNFFIVKESLFKCNSKVHEKLLHYTCPGCSAKVTFAYYIEKGSDDLVLKEEWIKTYIEKNRRLPQLIPKK